LIATESLSGPALRFRQGKEMLQINVPAIELPVSLKPSPRMLMILTQVKSTTQEEHADEIKDYFTRTKASKPWICTLTANVPEGKIEIVPIWGVFA